MKRDPIVDEVRRAREAHAARFNYDLTAICADLRKKNRTLAIRLLPVNLDCGGKRPKLTSLSPETLCAVTEPHHQRVIPEAPKRVIPEILIGKHFVIPACRACPGKVLIRGRDPDNTNRA